ncbi:MAG: FAD-dependent oxidoreductase [Ignavibacteriales bacterium]|nr:FAD-dependent oxidoreductase [Ignavibacteriales bacterium]
MPYDVLIIGGGISGLSAAVELSSRGASVLLLEQRPHLGGRTYSFKDRKTGDSVDNGQHLLMGCYHETRRYLEIIDSAHLAELQKNLRIDFIHAKKGSAALKCLALPAPLHVLSGLLRLKTLSFANRLKLLRIGTELLAASSVKESELASLTVDQWLEKCGQPEENRKYLWDIIAVGSLNDETSKVSALLFYRVLKAAFLGNRLNASLLVPRVGLSELLVHPAEEYLKQKGVVIRKGAEVQKIEGGRDGVMAVVCNRRREKARSYISAIPYFALQSVLVDSFKSSPSLARLSRFQSSPIITLHLWFDRTVMEQEFVAVLDSTVQWIFNKSALLGIQRKDQQLSLVISAASKIVNLPKERLVRIALNELSELLPHTREARLVHSLVIKEKRATFSPVPDVISLRPGTRSGIPNLFLAGDWTDTGFPATIEGAVMSGRKAVEEVFSLLR